MPTQWNNTLAVTKKIISDLYQCADNSLSHGQVNGLVFATHRNMEPVKGDVEMNAAMIVII